jgi:hypothetical protein
VTAAAKKIIASVSSIINWPLRMLAAKATTANKRLIRWAVRKRVGAAYLLALFWFWVLTGASVIWALVSFRPHATVLEAVILLAAKFMALLLYAVKLYEYTVRVLRHYRRHFGQKRCRK